MPALGLTVAIIAVLVASCLFLINCRRQGAIALLVAFLLILLSAGALAIR